MMCKCQLIMHNYNINNISDDDDHVDDGNNSGGGDSCDGGGCVENDVAPLLAPIIKLAIHGACTCISQGAFWMENLHGRFDENMNRIEWLVQSP